MRWGAVVMLAILALGALPVSRAVGAGNIISGSTMTQYRVAITANTLKPAACAAISPTVVSVTGTSGADLLLGTAAADTISAAGGNDCVLGGGGNDSINCGAGTDVAVGGPGTDTFNANCETQIQ